MAADEPSLRPNHLCEVSCAARELVWAGWVSSVLLDLVVPAHDRPAPVRHRGPPVPGDVEVLADLEAAGVGLVVVEVALLSVELGAPG